MKFQKTKLSLLVFALAFGGALSGCTSDKNSDPEVPDTEDPVTNPDPDPTPDPEPEPDPVSNMPLSEGAVLFQLHELDDAPATPRMVRSTRELNGSTISLQKEDTAVDDGTWTDVANPVLTSRIYSSTTDGFVEANGVTFAFEGDGQNYVYRFQNTDVRLDVDHFTFNATSQNVRDTVSLVFGLPKLGSIMQETPQFDGSEQIYLETLEFIDPGIIYSAGKDDGTNCLLWDDTVTSETPATTENCNFVVSNDGDTGLTVADFTTLVDEDPVTAPLLKGSVFMTENFRLIADAGSTTAGDVIPGSTTDIIGAWSMVTLGSRDAILVQLADTETTSGYVNPTEWSDPSAFYLLQDSSKLRIAPVFEAETTLKTSNWLMGADGIDFVRNSIDLSGGG